MKKKKWKYDLPEYGDVFCHPILALDNQMSE